jgi:hypothetical protein
VTKENVMRRLIIAAGLLAVGVIGLSPAHADYAVVQFGDGHCQIWWNSVDNPWGASWSKIAIGMPDRYTAQTALDSAYSQGICR